MNSFCFRMASPPFSSPPKHHYQPSLTKRLETTKRRPENLNRTLQTQLEESPETTHFWRPRDRSDTDPTQIRRSSDTPRGSSDSRRGSSENPRGSSESEIRSPSFSGRRLRTDLSRKVGSREMGRNSLPGGVKLSIPATRKLTMMERMSRKRVLSDGDFSGEYLYLQVCPYVWCVIYCAMIGYRVVKVREVDINCAWCFRGRVPNFNQSEARKHCFLASDWFIFGTLHEDTVLYTIWKTNAK